MIPARLGSTRLRMWKRESFLENFQKNGHTLMGGVFSTYPVSKLSGMSITI
jgi:hypothetical protein